MTRKFIPVGESFAQWSREPDFTAAHGALDAEFTLASALIKARAAADMRQEQVARAVGTTQAAIARLESGRGATTTRTLERYAKATGMRLKISFEPDAPISRRRFVDEGSPDRGRRLGVRHVRTPIRSPLKPPIVRDGSP